MKVIGIVGSARRGRNTATLVQRVLEGAKSEGLETSLFYISDYDIRPCLACMTCKRTGKCSQDDDMKTFYEAFRDAKVIVLGTPIYLDHISAQTKLFLDRMYPYLGPSLEHRFPKGVKAVLVVTWGASGLNAYDDVVKWLKGRLSGYFDIETVAVLKAANADAVPVDRQAQLLERAFHIGEALAEYFRTG